MDALNQEMRRKLSYSLAKRTKEERFVIKHKITRETWYRMMYNNESLPVEYSPGSNVEIVDEL